MPNGSQGQMGPADTVGNAVQVEWMAAGEDQEIRLKQPAKRKGCMAGARARQDNTTMTESTEIAKKAAMARWG